MPTLSVHRNSEFQKDLSELRRAYVKSRLFQRHRVIQKRIRYPDFGPNRLVAMVSAIEAFARSVLLQLKHVRSGEKKEAIYSKIRTWKPPKLMQELRSFLPDFKPSNEEMKCFRLAIGYRDLLIHECTFLRGGTTARLIRVIESLFGMLEKEMIKQGFLAESQALYANKEAD